MAPSFTNQVAGKHHDFSKLIHVTLRRRSLAPKGLDWLVTSLVFENAFPEWRYFMRGKML
jgi:hypothetical protein